MFNPSNKSNLYCNGGSVYNNFHSFSFVCTILPSLILIISVSCNKSAQLRCFLSVRSEGGRETLCIDAFFKTHPLSVQWLLNIFLCIMENSYALPAVQTILSFSLYLNVSRCSLSLWRYCGQFCSHIINDGSAFYPSLNEIRSARRGSLIGGNWMSNVSAPLEWENSRGGRTGNTHAVWQQPSSERERDGASLLM